MAKRNPRFSWSDLPDEKLLDLRLCDLDLKLEGTEVQRHIDRLYRELDRKGISFHPHFWLSDEWFAADGVTGVAIPFYLAHPRLRRLERRQMLEVEGGTERSFLRILRHETGHTLESAFQLHRRKRYRELFGLESTPYPKTYQPKPFSKSFVVHLDMWYAQAHPSEDFAETFAVWLNPASRWKTRYRGWGALRKLKYIDELMRELAGAKPRISNRKHVDPLHSIRKTLREHYSEKRARYAKSKPDFYDSDLRKLFSDDRKYRQNVSAAKFLVHMKPMLRKVVARWTGEYQYTIEQVLDDIVNRCRELKLRLVRPPQRTLIDALVMVTVQTMNYLHAGNHRVAL
jgi:hypothetical protein